MDKKTYYKPYLDFLHHLEDMVVNHPYYGKLVTTTLVLVIIHFIMKIGVGLADTISFWFS